MAYVMAEDKTKVRFCKDCNHCISILDHGTKLIRPVKCCSIGFDVATGNNVGVEFLRADESLCGRDGKHWEQVTEETLLDKIFDDTNIKIKEE